ncbi:MAG: hypothetical protein WAK17_11225 [Candidatus Nitrosopolaris sp.]|jgi:hypothetical protein
MVSASEQAEEDVVKQKIKEISGYDRDNQPKISKKEFSFGVKDFCWVINIHYTLSRILLCYNIFYTTRLTVECKTLRKGFLAVGMAMVVLAVILFAPSSWIKGVQSSNVQKCNSFTGQLFQTLSQEDSAICHIAPALLVMSQSVLVVSILLGFLGVALVVVGAIKERPKPIKDEIK